jgi:NAD(P) transhydrogenase subunit alpha
METVINFIGENTEMIYIIVLAIFVGFVLIANIPSVLHTPLMSGANAMSGVIVIGAIILMGKTDPNDTLALLLGSIAVVLGSFNVVGGFAVTDRMLQMFKKKPKDD